MKALQIFALAFLFVIAPAFLASCERDDPMEDKKQEQQTLQLSAGANSGLPAGNTEKVAGSGNLPTHTIAVSDSDSVVHQDSLGSPCSRATALLVNALGNPAPFIGLVGDVVIEADESSIDISVSTNASYFFTFLRARAGSDINQFGPWYSSTAPITYTRRRLHIPRPQGQTVVLQLEVSCLRMGILGNTTWGPMNMVIFNKADGPTRYFEITFPDCCLWAAGPGNLPLNQ